MNFSNRGQDVISCSSLPRLAACAGSWLLSKGCPDHESDDGKAGDIVHWLVSFFAVGGDRIQADKYQTTHPELWDQARTMWGHAKRSAEEFFGAQSVLRWTSEERVWMLDENLDPILSGQYDLLCTSGGGPNEAGFVIFDLKSGFLSGDVPRADKNWQIAGMASILRDKYGPGVGIFGSIVREWAAEEPQFIENDDVSGLLEQVYASKDPGEAGLKSGPHCRWCPANLNGRCPIKRDQLSLVLKSDLTISLQELPDDGLVRILKAKKAANQVLEAAEEEARRRHAEGKEIAGCSWEEGSVRRTIKDIDGLLKDPHFGGLPVKTKVDVKLSDVEATWLKAKGLKGKDGKDAFTAAFSAYLELKRDKESLIV